jgi:hypothetical protein
VRRALGAIFCASDLGFLVGFESSHRSKLSTVVEIADTDNEYARTLTIELKLSRGTRVYCLVTETSFSTDLRLHRLTLVIPSVWDAKKNAYTVLCEAHRVTAKGYYEWKERGIIAMLCATYLSAFMAGYKNGQARRQVSENALAKDIVTYEDQVRALGVEMK